MQGTLYNLISNLNRRLDALISNNIFLLDIENIASNIIETISGDKLNENSIKAAVEDISKKNLGKYL